MELFFGLDLTTILLLTLVAFTAGFVDSVAGGGGLLMTPSLLLAGLPPQLALGTNKLVAISGTATAVVNFTRNGQMLWRIALIGSIFSLIGSVIGTNIILTIDDAVIAKIILALLPLTAIIIFIPKKKIKSEVGEFSSRELYFVIPLFTLILGVYDGFFGPGTGTFLVIAFYSMMGMNMIKASGVAKVINLSSGIGSFITFAVAGKVLYSLALPLMVGDILGAYIGSKTAIKKGLNFIRYMIIAVFVVMFISLIYRYLL